MGRARRWGYGGEGSRCLRTTASTPDIALIRLDLMNIVRATNGHGSEEIVNSPPS